MTPATTPRTPLRRLAAFAVLCLALVAVAGLTAGVATGAKKKKKAASVFQQTATVNLAIPQDAATGPSAPVRPIITVPKAFKGKVVGDIDVTNIRTTGSGAGAADDLRFRLSAPNGRSVTLINNGIGDVSIGPLTLNDDTNVSICDNAVPPCVDERFTLNRPFAGTANLLFLGGQSTGGLSAFDGVGMRGAWTLTVWDAAAGPGTTSTLNTWGLKITPAKPVT